jgi:hypothetical protein
MQRLIEQPSGDGRLFEEAAPVGRVHYHLAVYQHFADHGDDPVPAHIEVEGRLTALDDFDVGRLHGLNFEWTLQLADGRALDIDFVDASGAIHSTGRGLHVNATALGEDDED